MAVTYGEHYVPIPLAVAISPLGVVLFVILSGAMLPFVLRRVRLPGECISPICRQNGACHGVNPLSFLCCECHLNLGNHLKTGQDNHLKTGQRKADPEQE